MANEGNVRKRNVSVRAYIELCKKVEVKFSRPEDTDKTVAYIRALEEATRDVRLTTRHYEEIAKEAKANEAKRIRNRNKKNGGR